MKQRHLMHDPQNSYLSLARMLSVANGMQASVHPAEKSTANTADWNQLLLQANLQLCPTLWFQRMRQSDRLEQLPSEMGKYLGLMLEENRERNLELLEGLETLISSLSAQGITPIILKGAASLVQGLYQDAGERILSDLDLLVHPEEVSTCERVLVDLGYMEIRESFREEDGLATDQRHNHINPYVKPDTPLTVEIHTRTAYGISSGVLPAESTWAEAIPIPVGNAKALALSPTHQVLLNILHALLPKHEFISGESELRQLAELDRFSRHFTGEVDWDFCLQRARQYGLRSEFAAYITLANQLFNTGIPLEGPLKLLGRLHAARICNKQHLIAATTIKGSHRNIPRRIKLFLHNLYYLSKLPGWIWNHPCYAEDWRNFPDRLIMLGRKLTKRSSWKKV